MIVHRGQSQLRGTSTDPFPSSSQINTHGLLYTLRGQDPSLKPALFMGHVDTVPVNGETLDDWTYRELFSRPKRPSFIHERNLLTHPTLSQLLLRDTTTVLMSGEEAPQIVRIRCRPYWKRSPFSSQRTSNPNEQFSSALALTKKFLDTEVPRNSPKLSRKSGENKGWRSFWMKVSFLCFATRHRGTGPY